MAITFDNQMDLSFIFRYDSSADSFSSDLSGQNAFDYFPDDAEAGDIIYFGKRDYSMPWHDLKFYVGTALAADSITLEWEYWKYGSWVAIPSVTDNTNDFTTTGENWVTFPIPEEMYDGGSFDHLLNGEDAMWIRCRISSVTNLTEGGAQSTQIARGKDYTITIEEGTTAGLADIYSADQTNSWGVMEKMSAESYLIKSNFCIKGTFQTKDEFFQVSTESPDIPTLFWSTDTSSVEFGELNGNYGSRGSKLYWYAKKPDNYSPVWNLKCYGSTIHRGGSGSFNNFMFKGVADFRDSVIRSSDKFYFEDGVTDGKLYRTLYDVSDRLYIYSKNVDINGFKLSPDCSEILCGSDATIKNVTFTSSQTLDRYYEADVELINCDGLLNSNIQSGAPRQGDVYVWKKYTLDLQIIDEDNTPIDGATVKINDVDGSDVVDTTTDANGDISTQTIIAYQKWWVEAEGYTPSHEKSFNPFTLQISKAGYKTIKKDITLDEKKEWTISLEHSPYQVEI